MIPISMIIGWFNLHAISLVYALKHKKYYDVAGLMLYYITWFGTIVSTPFSSMNILGVCLKDFNGLSSFLGDLVHPHEIMFA